MLGKILIVCGIWILTDGLISIRLYIGAKDETGKRMQSWARDHSIRILRCLLALVIVVIGFLI